MGAVPDLSVFEVFLAILSTNNRASANGFARSGVALNRVGFAGVPSAPQHLAFFGLTLIRGLSRASVVRGVTSKRHIEDVSVEFFQL